MFADIDQIDWNRLGHHVYGDHQHIPQAIRNLLSSDAQTRAAARGFLFGQGQDFGDIYDTTPHLIPFLLELLITDDAPDKVELLARLTALAAKIFYTRRRSLFSRRQLSVHQMRLCLATYDALRAALPTYIRLLAHDSIALRRASVELVEYLTDDVEQLLPALMHQFQREQDEQISIALLQCLKTLFGSLDWRQAKLHEQYAPFFLEVITTHPVHVIQVAAARAAVELVQRYELKFEQVFPMVPALLAQEFLECRAPLDDDEQAVPSYQRACIVQDLARLKPEPLLKLLHHPAITPEQAHLLARGLLAYAFHNATQAHWEQEPAIDHGTERMMYVYARDRAAEGKLAPRQSHILQALVEVEKVWECPTNMFSFFYGLPDSRQALQALLNE